MNREKKKFRYMIATNWCYPFGGGEEFMYQTMEWVKKSFDAECYWISFESAKNKFHEKFEIKKDKIGIHIYLSGGFDKKVFYNWLKLINPDIVHHQGNYREEFYAPCDLLKIPFLSGFHFWSGAIFLDPQYGNIDILKNHKYHKVDDELIRLINKKYCYLYTVSPFVKECIKKICDVEINDMIYSASLQSRYKVVNKKDTECIYITCINIHKLKGGEIFLELIKALPKLNYIGIQTEYNSEKLDDEIKDALANNNKIYGTKNLFIGRCENPIEIFEKTKILFAPSLCDETFCRTVNEAMMNGIPVVTTGQGNIKYLVGEKGLIYDKNDINGFINEINKLSSDQIYYNEQKTYHLNEYEKFSESKASIMFKNILIKILNVNKTKNVMLFGPWCDQGLGIQIRNYYNILKNNGYNPIIFAMKPYNASTCIELQKDPKEWSIKNIYYSPNEREKITDVELKEFVDKYSIGQCIIPETCFSRVFEIAKFMRDNNIYCYAIPNIEIVRKDEIYKHKYFYKILCNNFFAQKIFNDYGINETSYIGYGIKNGPEFKEKKKSETINFLFIGGMNAFSRKNILSICEGFDIVTKKHKNVRLTCTIQKTNNLEIDLIKQIEKYNSNKQIDILFDHISYKDILNLYYDSHISIQVSKHEGLGLGFYEAIYTGTPVITLDTPPHNEIINHNVNGWIIDCYYKPMIDNHDPIFDSAYFDPLILADQIQKIISNPNFDQIYDILKDDLENRLSHDHFKQRFLSSII